jgi:hypothetical protein
MSAFFTSWPFLWAQANAGAAANAANNPAAAISPRTFVTLMWLFLASDPSVGTRDSLVGGLLIWIKAISLICLVCWVVSWLIIGTKERIIAQGHWFDFLGVAGAILTPVAVMLKVLEDAKQLPPYRIGGYSLTALAAILCVVCFVAWAEIATARTIKRLGRRSDALVLIGIHIALALGVAIGLYLHMSGLFAALGMVPPDATGKIPALSWLDGLVFGVRFGVTYMGFVVLFRVAWEFFAELFLVRGRRLYSIARLAIYESNRKMWAPWVVVTVFLLVLAFTHWFLQPPRAAEMGRLYVGTLSLLCSILLTVMVTIMTPLSLPTDIQQQTIYTVVSKPVRRSELIWGRMIGYMAIVTLLVAVFGAISLAYLWRTVGSKLVELEQEAVKAKKENRIAEYKLKLEQADQLRVRMQARVPIKGSLSFLDSRGTPHAVGIDVGADQSMKEPRSHIEGATPSAAIWRYGRLVPDPFTRPGSRPNYLNRQIPVEDFIFPGTIDWQLDRVYNLAAQIEGARREKDQPNVSAARMKQLDAAIIRNQDELARARGDYEALVQRAAELKTKAATLASSGNAKEAAAVRAESASLSSPPIKVEMSFNVYRTTKGKIGEPVYAEIEAINPRTNRKYEGDVFPIKEYYTNQVSLPAWILAGSDGSLQIQIRCLTQSQYLGMAESDLYLLSSSGNFGFNYMKGLFGVWLQAMVLTAIGVFAGTFLSWPVALLTTIFFFVAGQLAFAFLVDFSRQAIMGGGPFESLIRIISHDNQMNELTPTAAVMLAKTLDSLAMPVMSTLVYLVPNFQVLDVSNLVADGFMVSWRAIISNLLLALGYAVPFSFAGYLILKNREVAA